MEPERVIHQYERHMAQVHVHSTATIVDLELKLEDALSQRNNAIKHAADLQERLNNYESGVGVIERVPEEIGTEAIRIGSPPGVRRTTD